MIIKAEVGISIDSLLGKPKKIRTYLTNLELKYIDAKSLRIVDKYWSGELTLEIEREETYDEVKTREILEANKKVISAEADRVMKVRKAKKRIRALGC